MSNKKLYFIALFPLLAGALYYFFMRPQIAGFGWMGIEASSGFASVSYGLDFLPTFVHQFSFSLLTWLFLDKRHPLASIALWALINLLFEFGQLAPAHLLTHFPPLLRHYFLSGTFSWGDIGAIFAASVLAYMVMLSSMRS